MISSGQKVDFLIIGAGFAGIGVAYQLKNAGFDNFLIIEKGSEPGGTWRDNRYPGAACDVQSHLYSYSFFPKPDWTRSYAGWHEIKQYFDQCVHTFGLTSAIRLNTKFTDMTWLEENQCWQVVLNGVDSVEAKYVILATGLLHHPKLPDFPGLSDFKGQVLHTAQWDATLSTTGKRIGVIGTGASAIQLVPELAKSAESLHVIQRTPAWVMPRNDRAYRRFEKVVFERFPLIRRMHRGKIYLQNEARFVPMHQDLLSSGLALLLRYHISRVVKNRETAKKLTPGYSIGCKRILLSNDWYPAFNRANVHLHTHGIKQVGEWSVTLNDDSVLPLDILVCATGFITDPRKYLENVRIVGRSGKEVKEAWKEIPHAYKGITVPGFPNLFLLNGPNTGVGHNSVIFMIECQVRYLISLLGECRRTGASVVEVKKDREAVYNEKIQRKLSRRVWASGCSSWYLDEQGRNFSLWPDTATRFYWETRKARLADYNVS